MGDIYYLMLRLAQCACPTPGVNPLPSAPTHLPSRTAPFLSELVKRPASKMHLLYISELFSIYPAEAIDWPSARYRNTRFARLNCLFGQAVAEKNTYMKSRLDVAYTWAAPMVYQLLNYTWYGNWGPFEDDEKGKVDWTRVEASMVLLGHNTADGPYELGYMMKAPPFSGSYPYSFSCPHQRRDPRAVDETDPYGITGTWIRVSGQLAPFSSFSSLKLTNRTTYSLCPR